jgi:hypothetical protein
LILLLLFVFVLLEETSSLQLLTKTLYFALTVNLSLMVKFMETLKLSLMLHFSLTLHVPHTLQLLLLLQLSLTLRLGLFNLPAPHAVIASPKVHINLFLVSSPPLSPLSLSLSPFFSLML